MHTVNKVFMFAIVLDTHVEILFISGDPEGGLSITLYPPLSIVFASSYWKVLMILVNIILKIKYVHCKQISNGVSDVLKELYGVLELMTVYILGWCWCSLRWCWTSGHGGWGINKKWIKAESSEDGIYIHFLDEEKIQVSDSVTAVHLTMFVV